MDPLLSLAERPNIHRVSPPPMEDKQSVADLAGPDAASPLPYVVTQDEKDWDADRQCTSPYLNAGGGSRDDSLAAALLASSEAPRFCPHDEEKEWAAVTPDEMREIEKDLGDMKVGECIGRTNTFAPQTPWLSMPGSSKEILDLRRESDENEGSAGLTDEEREVALLPDLEVELAAIPEGEKMAYLMALKKCPELVDDAHKQEFLLKEGFDAKLAARGIILHWQYKFKLFGCDKCFRPISMGGPLSDDMFPLSDGFLNVLQKDIHGRSLIFIDPSRYHKTYPRESVLRALWYLMIVINQDTLDRRRGFVLVLYPKKASYKQFDPVLLHSISLVLRYTPTLLRSIHVCHPEAMFHVVKPMMMHVCGPRMRKRFRVHYGSNERVLQKLAECGIPRDHLPSELGGTVNLDPVKWLSARIVKDAQICEAYRPCPPSPGASDSEHSDLDLDNLEPISLSEARKMVEEDYFLSSLGLFDADQVDCGEPIDLMAEQRMCDRQRREETSNEGAAIATDVSTPESDDHCVSRTTDRKISTSMRGAVKNMMKPSRKSKPEKDVRDSQPPAKDGVPASASGSISKIFKVRAVKRAKERWQDPRMARAVEARINAPHMSLFDALVAGGFVFPGTKQSGDTDKNFFDSEHVSLHQRKNQLCRRLRAKRKDDPRMSRAVAAKLNDPAISLVNALLAGGFEFCGFDGTVPVVAEKNIRGLDNVSLYSRKKELIRKLAQLESLGQANVCNPAA